MSGGTRFFASRPALPPPPPNTVGSNDDGVLRCGAILQTFFQDLAIVSLNPTHASLQVSSVRIGGRGFPGGLRGIAHGGEGLRWPGEGVRPRGQGWAIAATDRQAKSQT